jgi:CRP-like cAMP-binding protein
MAFDLILKNVAKHISLTAKEGLCFLSLLKEKEYSKKEFILREGQVCKYINFVNSGTLRAYYTGKTGKDATIMFALTDWWVTDMFCFINQQPALLNIVAMEQSSVLQLQKDDLDTLYDKIPKFERFFRIILQNAYIREQLRVMDNISLSAEERYNKFLTKYPQIVKQVPQKQIASYLGITPEFLSAIRGNRTKS